MITLETLQPSRKTTMNMPPQATTQHMELVKWFNIHRNDMVVIGNSACLVCGGRGNLPSSRLGEPPEACRECDGSGNVPIYQLDGVRGNIHQLYKRFSPVESVAAILLRHGIQGREVKFYMRPAIFVAHTDLRQANNILTEVGYKTEIYRNYAQPLIVCNEEESHDN